MKKDELKANTLMKTALITGPTSGIGKATAESLILDHHLILWCRNPSEQSQLVSSLQRINPTAKVMLCGCDLADWDRVVEEAEKLLQSATPINTLVLNAGQLGHSCEMNGGLEQNFRSGHLGHLLLALKLIPALEKQSDRRLVIVSSVAHIMGNVFRPFQPPVAYTPVQAYGDLKLANRLMALAWSRHYPEIPAASLHPGVVNSSFGNHGGWWVKLLFKLISPFILTAKQGAKTSIYLSRMPISQLKALNGHYFIRSKRADQAGTKKLKEDAEKSWSESMKKIAPWLSN